MKYYQQKPIGPDADLYAFAVRRNPIFDPSQRKPRRDEYPEVLEAVRAAVFLRSYNGADNFDGWQIDLEPGSAERIKEWQEDIVGPFIDAATDEAAHLAGSLRGATFWAVGFTNAALDEIIKALRDAKSNPPAAPVGGSGVDSGDDSGDDQDAPGGKSTDDDAEGGGKPTPPRAPAKPSRPVDEALAGRLSQIVAAAKEDAEDFEECFEAFAGLSGLSADKLEQSDPESIAAAVTLMRLSPMLTRVLGRSAAAWGNAEAVRRVGLEIESVGAAQSISDILGSELAKLRGPMRADTLRRILSGHADGFTRAEYVDGEMGPVVIGVDRSSSMRLSFGAPDMNGAYRGHMAAAVALVALIDLDATRRPWKIYGFTRRYGLLGASDQGSVYRQIPRIAGLIIAPDGDTNINGACRYAGRACEEMPGEPTHLLITDCEDEIEPSPFTRNDTDCILIGDTEPLNTFRSVTALDDDATIEDAVSAAFLSIKDNRHDRK